MRIGEPADVGRYVQERRRQLGLTQSQLATSAGVSRRWLSDLESGKATTELGLVLRTLNTLGLVLDLRPQEADLDLDLDEYLKRFRRDTPESRS
ncbi:helix-turn-helix domain-containing protein [Phytohabitans aurantiacus]|uniref:HTH cro/C1-type domain-containing protein n=1 Tax=Phytohabitans aurantiacus TaxID=3016789 RepID=A0ABQ5R2H2_9ACTN|nr:helix-turn-helix domain-containing protein [Phytohabitans aurantiacus]GLI00408.1 hypothetical protein Pa4123_56840 [Phytohabitans aurantiacus]